MNPPKRLRIGPGYVKVILNKGLGKDVIGSYSPSRGIELGKGLKGGALADVFLHEVLHALFHVFSIEEGRPEEIVVGQVASLVTVFWAQNPSALKWWAKLLESE